MNKYKSQRRSHPVGNYLLLLALTFGAYWLYSVFVVPSIEVASTIKPVPMPDDVPEYVESTEHHPWFAQGNWELEPCSILHTAHGKILFQDHQVEDPKTWFVTPFTLVLRRDKETDERGGLLPPLVLRCETGARLNFSNPVLTNFNASGSRLESALLEGAVELYRLNSAPENQDGMRIETSNVQISDQQILTIEDVAFWFGPNQGIGRNMRIHLTHSSPSSSVSRDFSRINGIKSLQLGFLNSLKIRPPSKKNKTGPGKLLANDGAPIEITATGPFGFDMETHRARFNENVRVRKLDGRGDSLSCDDLTLQFSSKDGSKSIKLDAATDTEFELQEITAIGSPVVLHAASHDAWIEAERVQYDVMAQSVKASGKQSVDIRQGTSRFVATEIEYALTQDNTIGPLIAKGPGMLIRSDSSRSFRATWQEMLTLKPVSDQQQLVVLTGGAKLKLDRQTAIESERIELNVWQVPVVDVSGEVVDWEYQPAQLTANGEVEIQSDKMQGKTQRLVANWPSNPQAPRQQLVDVGNHNKPGTPRTTAGDERQLVRRVSFNAEPAERRLRFQGEQIDVVLIQKNDETELVELQINGNVTVTKPSSIPRQPTFKVRGDSLKLLPQGQELFQVQIDSRSGSVSHLTADRMNLTGPAIFLDQSANRMWVQGAGNLLIESQPGSTDHSETQADVNFSGGMVFDGQKIYFERDVVARIKQQASDGHVQVTDAKAAAASLTLDQRISLQENQAPTQQSPKVVDLILKDRISPEQNQFKLAGFAPVPITTVVLNNQKLDRAGKLIERIAISATGSELNESTQTITAYGPGSVELVRQGGASMPGLPGASIQRNANALDKSQFTYIHSRFDRVLQANTGAKQLAIKGNTRSVHANVSDASESFDPDRPQSLPEEAVLLRCSQLDVSQSPNPYDGKLQSRMIATGNARISSATYDTAADRIRYDESADLLLVESANGRDVVLRSRQNPGAPWKDIVGKRLSYRLSTQSAKAEGVEQIIAPFNKRP